MDGEGREESHLRSTQGSRAWEKSPAGVRTRSLSTPTRHCAAAPPCGGPCRNWDKMWLTERGERYFKFLRRNQKSRPLARWLRACVHACVHAFAVDGGMPRRLLAPEHAVAHASTNTPVGSTGAAADAGKPGGSGGLQKAFVLRLRHDPRATARPGTVRRRLRQAAQRQAGESTGLFRASQPAADSATVTHCWG